MVLSVFNMIVIMLIDRIIYTIASFKAFEGEIEPDKEELNRLTNIIEED